MDLYLVRHASAEPRDRERWRDDSRRPLSTDGIELFRLAARGLRRIGVEVEAVLTSSYLRASHTAELLTEEVGWPAAEMCDVLEPPATGAESVRMLASRPEACLALVGHQPELAELASLLVAGTEHGVRLDFKKGGVMCLRIGDRPVPGAGVLLWSLSPKILRRLGS